MLASSCACEASRYHFEEFGYWSDPEGQASYLRYVFFPFDVSGKSTYKKQNDIYAAEWHEGSVTYGTKEF